MSTAHQFVPTILREYDIRGVVGETLHARDAHAVGLAFGTAVRGGGGRTVSVGYDGRLSSPELEAALVEGLRACGLTVWRIGLGPTPMLYFATTTIPADAGIMVTGSHNPPDQNGFKMMLRGAAFYGEAIQNLARVASAGAFHEDSPGEVVQRPIAGSYVERLVAGLEESGPLGRPLSVAWDAGNGAAGGGLAEPDGRLPGPHVLLDGDIDGRFPAHHPDPTVERNLRQLQQAVAGGQYDLGIAFDGDGDRIGVVDERGRTLWADQLMILYARNVLRDHPGATIIADVKSSQVFFDEVDRAGDRPLMWRTGHSLIKSKMAETGSPLAGEMSGHIFFGRPYYGFDDALYAAVRLIGILGQEDRPLSVLRTTWPGVVNTPEQRVPSTDARKFAVIDRIKEQLREQDALVNDIDGVRVQTDDGWWLLRASNTQAILVARCEARNPAALDRLKLSVNRALEAVGEVPVDWEAA